MAYLNIKPQKERLVAGRPLSEAKDEDILTASLKNPNLFGVLVDRYQDAFMRSAQRVVKTREDAEDIVQEALAKIYKTKVVWVCFQFTSWKLSTLGNIVKVDST